MYAFQVLVPFEPVYQQNLWSSVISELPDAELPNGVRLRHVGTEYWTEVNLRGADPAEAKVAAIHVVEDFLVVLAAWNCAFQVRTGGVRAEIVNRPAGVVFVESRVEAVARRGDLTVESALYERREHLPQYVRNCLDLNYLLVLSARPTNQWILAATGLEALAVGKLGNQETVSDRLSDSQRHQLKSALQPILENVELETLGSRIVNRLFTTTTGRVADHVYEFLIGVGIDEVPADEINRWWRARGTLAHGGAVDVDLSSLQRLVDVFQKALRRTAGAESILRN